MVSYTDPTSGDDTKAVQDGDGNDGPSFTDFPVRNTDSINPPGGQEEPYDFTATPLGTDGILISWKPGWPNGSVTTGFNIQRAAQDKEVTDLVDLNWEGLVVDLAPDLRSYVDKGLLPGTARHYRIKTNAGSFSSTWAYRAFAETDDDTGPQIKAITVPASGDVVHILFDENLSVEVPGPDAFTVRARSIIRPVKSVAQSLDGHNIDPIDQDRHIVLTLDDYQIRQAETVTVSYTDPTSGDDALAVQDDQGNDAPSFTDIRATNISNVAPDRPSAPTGLSAQRDGSETTSVNLSWVTPRTIAKSGSSSVEPGDGLRWAEGAAFGSQGHGHLGRKPSLEAQGIQCRVDQGGECLAQTGSAQGVNVLIPAAVLHMMLAVLNAPVVAEQLEQPSGPTLT